MIQSLPAMLQIVMLALLGGVLGAVANWGVYSWTWFLKRSISPWQTPLPEVTPRRWSDRIPILGWLLLRRDGNVHGQWFWLRPLLIELGCTIGVPLLYLWLNSGGLVGGLVVPSAAQVETWFWLHLFLFMLMIIATFIDFDERTIPDYVTIPGTLFALVYAAIFPLSRLPEVIPGLAGNSIKPLSFANGGSILGFDVTPKLMASGVQWHLGWIGLAIGILIFLGWIWALLPKICTLRFGIAKGLWIMWFSLLRPPRKTDCPIRTTQRKPFLESVLLAGLAIVGTVLLVLAHRFLPAVNWESLFHALFGLGFGGLLIWGVRIVGGYALQTEAMGFGDVTLMAMVGAVLGWQITLLALPLACILGLFVTIGVMIITKENQLPFGPYLCLGTSVVYFTWWKTWPGAGLYFHLGEWLFVGLVAMMGLLMFSLMGLQALKGNRQTADS